MLKYIQIKFKKFGRDYMGCDCYGLVRLYYRDELKIVLPDFRPKIFTLESIEETADAAKQMFAKIEKPEINDIAVMYFEGMGTHVGIMVAPDVILHILENENACCENINTSYRLKGRKIEYFRYSK